jgi:hypothetical protein
MAKPDPTRRDLVLAGTQIDDDKTKSAIFC